MPKSASSSASPHRSVTQRRASNVCWTTTRTRTSAPHSPPSIGTRWTPTSWVRNPPWAQTGRRLWTSGLFDTSWFLCAGTSSIDTTCTIWGLETGQVLGRVNLVSGHVKTQLIAHDKEVCLKVNCSRVWSYAPLYSPPSLRAGVRHRVQPCRRRTRHVRLRGCRRIRPHVRPPAPGAQHHHLRGPAAPPAAPPLLEQTGPQLPGHHGHGWHGGTAPPPPVDSDRSGRFTQR